jgi:uncharacterized protein (DUF1330 family)
VDTQKATIIVEGTFAEGHEKYFEEYSAAIRNFLKKHNAVVIRRQLVKETLYGQNAPDLFMVIDFDDKNVAKKIFFENEYLQVIPLRDKIFKTFNMYLADAGNLL